MVLPSLVLCLKMCATAWMPAWMTERMIDSPGKAKMIHRGKNPRGNKKALVRNTETWAMTGGLR